MQIFFNLQSEVETYQKPKVFFLYERYWLPFFIFQMKFFLHTGLGGHNKSQQENYRYLFCPVLHQWHSAQYQGSGGQVLRDRCYASCVRYHISPVMEPVPYVRCPVSCVTRQLSENGQTEPLTASQSGIMYHLIGVMFHMTSVNCQPSVVKCQM